MIPFSSIPPHDCLAFDRTAHHPQLADRDSLQRAFDRYCGPFLEGELAPWARAFRERLRGQYLRIAERLGTLIVEVGDASVAIDHYLRAIEIEPLSDFQPPAETSDAKFRAR